MIAPTIKHMTEAEGTTNADRRQGAAQIERRINEGGREGGVAHNSTRTTIRRSNDVHCAQHWHVGPPNRNQIQERMRDS